MSSLGPRWTESHGYLQQAKNGALTFFIQLIFFCGDFEKANFLLLTIALLFFFMFKNTVIYTICERPFLLIWKTFISFSHFSTLLYEIESFAHIH